MVLTALEVIGSIATRPTDLDKNAFFVQRICHMQQFLGESNLTSVPPGPSPAEDHASRGARVDSYPALHGVLLKSVFRDVLDEPILTFFDDRC